MQEFWIQLNRESKSRLWKIDKIATSFWRAGIWQLYASKKDVFKSTDQPATLTIRKQRENISFCDSCSLTMPSKFFAISNELGSWLCESPHMGFTSTALHCCRSLFASLSSPTILPERLARCLDSWAEPQQVYRLQFRGLAATRAGDGRVMRPCTTQRGARHKSRHTQGLRAHQRSWFRTPKPLISNREHSNSHNKSLNSGVVQR